MHPTTKSRPWTSRLALLAVLAAILLLALATPALAAGTYTGGPKTGDYPVCIANDHSVYALRVEATAGLAADTAYYVKIRISPTATPSGGNSRGFTWNPDGNAGAGDWAQEREDWDQFPTITTDSSGQYAPGNTWTFFKFADTTKPAVGSSSTWYIVVSLQPVSGGGSGTTLNGTVTPAVTITDMTGYLTGATAAFRVHNGATITDVTKSQRVQAADPSDASLYYAVMRTQPITVDLGYGGTATGDFDIAVPVGMQFTNTVNSSTWSQTFTGTTADVDIALGNGLGDTEPPAAPDGFTSAIDGTTAHLSWDAVDGADHYVVYKWQDATPLGDATNYTPQHLADGQTAGTTYDVTGLTEGETYHFEVRAVDLAGNVGQPSLYPVSLTLQTSQRIVAWGGSAQLSGTLTDGAEDFTTGQQVTLQRSYDGTTWVDVDPPLDPVTSFTYSATAKPQRKTMYRLVFASDGVHQAKQSDPVTVTPRVKLGRPSAPKTVKKGKRFTVSGMLTPRHTSGSKTVKIRCYRRSSGAWHLAKTVVATNRKYNSVSRYVAKVKLTRRGTWKLVARSSATAKYAANTSSARKLKVK